VSVIQPTTEVAQNAKVTTIKFENADFEQLRQVLERSSSTAAAQAARVVPGQFRHPLMAPAAQQRRTGALVGSAALPTTAPLLPVVAGTTTLGTLSLSAGAVVQAAQLTPLVDGAKSKRRKKKKSEILSSPALKRRPRKTRRSGDAEVGVDDDDNEAGDDEEEGVTTNTTVGSDDEETSDPMPPPATDATPTTANNATSTTATSPTTITSKSNDSSKRTSLESSCGGDQASAPGCSCRLLSRV
jgi:hypothetical protein